MNIYLGNLTIKQMQARLGVIFPDGLVKTLEDTHQSTAKDIKQGKWHCFDIPFILVCGGKDFAMKIYKFLEPLQSDMKTQMQIGVQ